MLKRLVFTSNGLWETGAFILRLVGGLTIFKYGLEIFSTDSMSGYVSWLTDLNVPNPRAMAITGKIIELAGGLMMAIGLFTRIVAVPLIITMAFICFIMGEPEFLAADGSFLLLVIFFHFLLVGPGRFSLDHVLFTEKNEV